jgi:hypothetical protein
MLNHDQVMILWEECKDQNEWQRHNETQRAQLTTILLLISTALIAFVAQRGPQPGNGLIAVFLVVIGLFGILSVQKYWERWQEHFDKEAYFRQLIDKCYFPVDDEVKDKEGKPFTYGELKKLEGRPSGEGRDSDNNTPVHMLVQPRIKAMLAHNDSWDKFWYQRIFRDRILMQHGLWSVVFLFVVFIGLALPIIIR